MTFAGRIRLPSSLRKLELRRMSLPRALDTEVLPCRVPTEKPDMLKGMALL